MGGGVGPSIKWHIWHVICVTGTRENELFNSIQQPRLLKFPNTE